MTHSEKIEFYETELAEDVKWDSITVMLKLQKLGNIRQKWARRLYETRKKKLILEQQKEGMVDTFCQDDRIKKSFSINEKNVRAAAQKEPKIQSMTASILDLELEIAHLLNIIENLKTVGFDIKSYVEMRKIEDAL
jgi:hypothetical protein